TFITPIWLAVIIFQYNILLGVIFVILYYSATVIIIIYKNSRRKNQLNSCYTRMKNSQETDSNIFDKTQFIDFEPKNKKAPLVSPSLLINKELDKKFNFEIYHFISLIVGVVTFITAYIHFISTYGFLLGVGLGWIPALICGVTFAYIWPGILFILLILWAGSGK
ncbi:hypothetical protein, partial [Legionella maioricensis]